VSRRSVGGLPAVGSWKQLVKTIPFNKPFLTSKEFLYIAEAHAEGQLAGEGSFTKRCQD